MTWAVDATGYGTGGGHREIRTISEQDGLLFAGYTTGSPRLPNCRMALPFMGTFPCKASAKAKPNDPIENYNDWGQSRSHKNMQATQCVR